MRTSRTLVGILFALTTTLLWAKPDSFQQNYIEIEVTDYPKEVIDGTTEVRVKGYACFRKYKGNKAGCEKFAPQDLSLFDFEFTYPDATHDVSHLVQLSEKTDRFEFEAVLPNLPQGHDQATFSARITEKGKNKRGLYVAIDKIRAHIARLEQLRDKLPSKGLNQYQKLKAHLLSVEAKLLAKLRSLDSRWSERNIAFQVQNFVSSESSWMVSTDTWEISAGFPLGIGFQGETTWLDVHFKSYRAEGDEWKIQAYAGPTLLKEEILSGLTFSHRVLIPSANVGDNPVTLKVLGRNTAKNRPVFDEFISREVVIPRLEDTISPRYLSLIPAPGRYVGRDVPEFSLSLQDDRGRMDRATVDGVLIEDGGATFSLKNFLNFETSQATLVDHIHGNQNGSDFFTFYGNPVGVPEGFYNLQILTADFAGNQAQEAQWRFIVDRTSPAIAIPLVPKILSNDESYELPISVSDATNVIVQVFNNGVFQGETDQKEGDAIAVDLVDGPNMVKITAVDEAGNMSEVNYPPIFLDFTPPEMQDINLENGQLIRTATYNIEGISKEELSAVLVNGEEVDFDEGYSFSFPINLYTEGEQTITVELIDLAGNSTTIEYRIDFLLRLVDGNLIRVEKVSEDQMKIIGHPGATGPSFPLEISTGFLGGTELTANEDGSFELIMDSFDEAVVTATYPLNGREESALAKFKFDTTLAGVIKDKDNNPLPNVTVTIISSGQSALTDAAGRFFIPDPALGDQALLIDGSTIPVEYTLGEKEFSKISYNVTLGSRQQNILERPIYLVPKPLDGTETVISNGSAVIVSSPHAPGVTLDIPKGAAIFPGGSNSGTINIIEIPGDKTPIELPDEVIPHTVYALEPSGMKFRERVHLTLPNPNEFPEGTELVIVSRNSETGFWEIDGSATVTGPDTIETKDGQGISHFSEIFASPFGMEVKKFADGDKPRIDSLDGGVSTQVSLPSFKILGQDITPALTYNSNWANPNVLVTNIFDIPRKYYDVRQKDGISKWGVVGADIRIQTWITPEWIDAEFVAGNFHSDKMRFTGLPDMAVVSSVHNLSSLPSGIVPSKASYEISFKQLTLQTGKIKVRSDMGGTQTVKLKPQTTVEWHQVFPPDLQAPIYLQNKRNAYEGEGWKLNLTKTILNPQNDRVLLENENGGLAVYAVNNEVQDLAYDASGIEAIGTSGDNVYFVTGSNKLSRYADGTVSQVSDLPRYTGTVGINDSWYHGRSSRCVKSGFYGCKKREYTYRYNCNKYEAPFDTGKTARSLNIQNGSVHLLDGLGAIFDANNPYPLAGAMGRPNIFTSATNANSGASISSHCTNVVGENCLSQKLNNNTYVVSIKSRPANAVGYCNTATCYSGNCSPRTWIPGSGEVPQIGFADGPLGLAKFNKPYDFAPGNREGTYYVADYGNNLVRLVDLAVGNVYTVAGNRSTTDSGNGGLASNASMFHPRGVVVDADGSFYVSTERGYIRKVTPDGRINAFAGKPTTAGGILSDISSFEDLGLKNPSGMVIDHQKDILYVADTGHNRVLALDLSTNIAKVVAGNGSCVPGDTLAGKVALEVSFCSPEKIALDTNGNLIILDQVNKRVRRVNFTSPQDGLLQYKPLAKDNSMLYRNGEGEFMLSYRDGSQTIFNSAGLQVETSDRTGRVYNFQYNDLNQLVNVRFPTGQEMYLDYSGDRLSQITDPAGRVTQFVTGAGPLERVVFPDGSQRQFFYEEDGVLVEEKDQLGYSTVYNLNRFKRLQSIRRADNTVVQVSDALSQSVHEGEAAGTQELKSFKSDENRLQDIIRDAKGIETVFSRDTNGYVDTITDHEGRVTKVERDSEGRPTKIIRHDNTYSTMTYDPQLGDLISRYDSSSGSSEAYQYDQWGHLIRYTNGLGQTKQALYDSNTGLLLQETDFQGKVTTRSYGSLGLLTSITNPAGETSGLVYNFQGNIIQIINPVGEQTSISRDVAGNITSKTNAKGEITAYEFDSMNRLLGVKTPKHRITSYNYSAAGELLTIIDPEGNQTSFQYDRMKRVVRKVSPLGQVWQMSYDANGNVAQEIDPKGQIKTFTYNSENRLVSKALPDDIYQMSYDDRGNLLTLSNNSSNLSMEYISVAGEDRLASVVSSGVDMPSFSVEHFYNNLGNRTQIRTSVGTWTTNFDANNRISAVTGPNSMEYLFGFDSANRLSSISRPGSSTAISFDASSHVTQILHQKSGGNISGFSYERDFAGNRTRIQNILGNTVLNYDEDGQLVSASLPELQEIFAYDNLGNRISDNSGGFSYDEKKFRLTEDYAFIYAWDANGNLISKQEKGMSGLVYNFSYSSQNQLRQVQIFNGSLLKKEVFFVQDALGRRIKKQVINHEDSSKSYERKFAYDGDEILAVFDENNDLLARYTHSGMRTDDVLGVEITNTGASAGLAHSPGKYHFLKDALGSITDITDSAGNIVQRYTYSSFGKILKIIDAIGNELENAPVKTHYAFTNREWDEEIGLYHYRARAYDPHSGRFIQEDPHPGKLSLSITVVNKYIYGANSPYMNVDPKGEFIIAAIVIGAVVGGLYAHFTGGNIIEGMLIGAAAGLAGGIVGGAVSAGIAPTIAGWTGSAMIGTAAGTIAGIGAGAIAGAFAGGITGGVISVLTGGSFEEGAWRGIATGLVAGAAAGGYGGYMYAGGGQVPGGGVASFIKSEAFAFMAPSLLIPTLVSLAAEQLDAEEEYARGAH